MVDTQSIPYDYSSLMHYGSTDFSVNGFPTIVPLQSGAVIGQRETMSEIDIQEVRLAYGCNGTGPTFPVTSEPDFAFTLRFERQPKMNYLNCIPTR